MGKEVAYVKLGSYGGYKVYVDESGNITIWQIGKESIWLPKTIAKQVLQEVIEAL